MPPTNQSGTNPSTNNSDESITHQTITEMSIDILARTLWGEARNEGVVGMTAVASVVLNRVAIGQAKGKYWWGTTIIQVCHKPYQFSCWNRSDPNYPKLLAATPKDKRFTAALQIAHRAVCGELNDQTGGATHYHADYVSPYWAKGQRPCVVIGRHLFYKLVEV